MANKYYTAKRIANNKEITGNKLTKTHNPHKINAKKYEDIFDYYITVDDVDYCVDRNTIREFVVYPDSS